MVSSEGHMNQENSSIAASANAGGVFIVLRESQERKDEIGCPERNNDTQKLEHITRMLEQSHQ
jgi:hypothetical protein